MKNSVFDVPISLHIFNRPKPTKMLFQQIRTIKPAKLFITADGPRESVLNDIENCEKARDIVRQVDWDCEIHKNFSDKNKGSFESTSGGITWVFKHVDRAIILEDDCIPNQSFFQFCSEMLDYYESDLRIALITGNNYMKGRFDTSYSYFFTRYTNMWGWATWKRTWDKIDFSMKQWPEYRDMGGLNSIFRKKHEVAYWTTIMQSMYDGKKGPHWDYLLMLYMFMNNALAVKPGKNLIKNVGYGTDATHFSNKHFMQEIETSELQYPLNHPPFIANNIEADEFIQYLLGGGRLQYEKNRIRRFLPTNIINLYRNFKYFVKRNETLSNDMIN